jgi:predicted transcriptional regulator
VASRWNRGLSKAEIAAGVREVLVPLFEEPASPEKIQRDIDEAWDTAVKKWGVPGTSRESPQGPVATDDGVEIDMLAIETRIERVEPIEFAGTTPTGLALLLDHFTPLTDAPPSSLALASCVVMSALAGPAPSLGWRGRHRAALFGVLVGHSGYGRKGATMREVQVAFQQVDPLLAEIEVSGIGSGEVLVDILNESKANTVGTSLIWEHEIANVLILASREGNIMSGNLRRAWDGDAVQSRSRAKGKSSAFGYNVAFMGGVTPSELEKRLTANDIANGWANRFLWFHSEKRPGGYDPTSDQTMAPATKDYLRDCIDHARRLGGTMLIKPQFSMRLTPGALSRMEATATRLDIPPVGAMGALQQRMPAHTIRLAMVAALFDQTAEVDEVHVEFGERMTAYALASMRSVFGIRVDDPVAMHILDVLTQVPDGWMNTTDLKKVTGKDHPRVKSALRILIAEGLVVEEQRATRGRPAVGFRVRRGL